ncbi:NAD(P)-binding protein [Ramicandelaber brevisporus]|nr:NAD(P)-binding protein [Ramicandelaber brevisporus]
MLVRGIYRNTFFTDYKVTERLDNKVAIVTGANVGIGKVTAFELAKAGAHVILASRSAEKTAEAIADINQQLESIAKSGSGSGNGSSQKVGSVEFMKLDLASFASIRQFVKQFHSRVMPLHLLVCNAGLAGVRGPTADGLDMIYGTNHIGHVLLTVLLLPKIQSPDKDIRARVVFVASEAHYFTDTIDYDRITEPVMTGWLPAVDEYAMSKLAMVMFGQELARSLSQSPVPLDHQIGVYVVHPGVVASDVWRNAPFPIRGIVTRLMLSEEQGATCTLYAATSGAVVGKEGGYFEFCKETDKNPVTEDESVVDMCWKHSLQVAKLSPKELAAAHLVL